ncbi:hypothetical protein SAMN05444380_1321, partial [Thermophagus xiamenensis]
ANVPNFGVFCLLKDSDNSFSVKEIEYFGISLLAGKNYIIDYYYFVL